MSEAAAAAPFPPTVIDTHVHVFRRDARFATDRRYAPDYDALPAELLTEMAAAGVSRAVLVQPSFLGTDNGFLVDAIAERPDALLGIAVVDPEAPAEELAALKRAGVVGVRLNCIGKPAPDFAGVHGALARRLADQDLVLQIQGEGGQWTAMERFLSNPPCRVVIDHFGRTHPGDGTDGFAALLRAAAAGGRLWFKFSAPYRMGAVEARRNAQAIRAAVGVDRLVWGSDWPATQFEGRHGYGDTLGWLAEWVPEEGARSRVLARNPAELFALA